MAAGQNQTSGNIIDLREKKSTSQSDESRGVSAGNYGPPTEAEPSDTENILPDQVSAEIDPRDESIDSSPADEQATQNETSEDTVDLGEEDVASEEELLGAQLEELRLATDLSEINHEVAQIKEEGHSFGKPSKIKYGILFLLATIVDALDLLALTGVGYFIAAVISITLSLIMLWIFWLTNTKQNDAKKYQQKLAVFLKNLEKNMAHIERRTVQISRIAHKLSRNKTVRKIGGKGVAKIGRQTARIYKAARSSPLSKFIAASCANLVPALGLLPWQIIGTYLSYRDESEALKDAAKAADEAFGE
ncbi:MAG: hypothetical protein UW46_C0002G0040 [Candidatus Yanofskybacteria bacterium GW2011_GWF1_44_227]|uniref:Uncharacterized protein n=1 Tax=Candidatus Yanofskybacteria bacterium GW2011_GWE2_40_11 TaxID=1619033 RepID=A0A0G0T0L2_9BACT|nr:MAG: hypothetical protein UT69_C0004G0014 [Candidatus Yanofskybacteria bacterium GW2011_GWE1_40_10]KKR40645.1 MAG: hypothetical protein UT75_C0006G0024 [Candidatus Yanofskybacteria bacterium GW2011_GWE2_40_11]KKT15794.1 MAG: hypothetical protein UV97_C0002G0040 [Candidatus Yanofskybacteria bacterium GW2011_GWF2_43_596]KKT53484.1 MAG: hypothetical protein UW46_C0002G0040 [Candidatus Yanofskybacteria bacterium GW2011_GWF1_44_227]OGN35890.1 MAG: hypothetical protein A2241_03890 [Candidatus Yano